MTAPLYDVKARLSEYITYAENGEIVEITKHGTVSAVIISKKDFDENFMRDRKKFDAAKIIAGEMTEDDVIEEKPKRKSVIG